VSAERIFPIREVVNFLLDHKFLSSRLIPKIFRFANIYLRPDYDSLLGRAFMNLIPFFYNEPNSAVERKDMDIYIGLDENQNDEFILLKIDHHIPNFEYLKRRIGLEIKKHFFTLHGKINGIKIRISKLEDIRNGMKVIATLYNHAEEEKL
jgi:hypothetical protein